MTTPVKTFGEYVVCFEAESEHGSARHHFVAECGWTSNEFRRIANYAWFCAKVSIWKAGEELASDYLGACSYKTESEFYKKYEGDYFADMVRTCAHEINDPVLTKSVNAWRATLFLKTK